MDYSKAAVPLLAKLLDFLDTDITEIEKIENQYKLSRKRTSIIWLLFILLLCILWFSAFYLYQLWGMGAPFVVLFIFAIPIFFILKKSPNGFIKHVVPVIWVIMINITFSMILIGIYFSKFKWVNLILGLMIVFFITIFHMSLFTYLRNTILPRKKYSFQFVLVNGEILDVKLLSITKHDDYIVEVLNKADYKNLQVKINRLEIQQIRYQKTENDAEVHENHDT